MARRSRAVEAHASSATWAPTPLALTSSAAPNGGWASFQRRDAARAARVDLDPTARRGVEEVQPRRLDLDLDVLVHLEVLPVLRRHERSDRARADGEVDEEVSPERLRQGDDGLDLARANPDVFGA